MKRPLALFFILLLSGCAIGKKTDYRGRSDFTIEPQDQRVIVAVHDLRPYVQNDDKSPNFTGIQKSLFGIPYNVTTKSGKPLADDFGLMIVNTMQFRKIPAAQQVIPYTWTFEEFKQKALGKEKGSKVYYIKMFEWKTESHFRPALHYNLELLIFDDQAKEVANSNEKGFFYFDRTQQGRENLATATRDILQELFAVNALNSQTTSPSPSTVQAEDNSTLKEQDSSIVEKESLLKVLPPETTNEIKNKCAKDYPEDYEMQADCVRKQAAGWQELNK